jgi:hypothetical protein
VWVNRVWHHLFGAGLVRSVDNFGTTGEPPSHPDLLDFLARRFTDGGWSTKSLVRELVLSRTYGLSTTHIRRAAAIDPENRLKQCCAIRSCQQLYPSRTVQNSVQGNLRSLSSRRSESCAGMPMRRPQISSIAGSFTKRIPDSSEMACSFVPETIPSFRRASLGMTI